MVFYFDVMCMFLSENKCWYDDFYDYCNGKISNNSYVGD